MWYEYLYEIYVQNSHKEVGICVPNPIKMNCGKKHGDANLNLKKMKTSGTLFKDNELHQVDTYFYPRIL